MTGRLNLPHKIRVSFGTAVVLGLMKGRIDVATTTAYLMTHVNGKCTANCGFCPQARSSQSRAELLSRVTWPVYSTIEALGRLAQAVTNGKAKRVCVQALNYPSVFDDICAIVEQIKQKVAVQVSVSCQPLNSDNLWRLSSAGVDRIGIALDAATEKLFNQVKGAAVNGPYHWEKQLRLLQVAIGVFGEGNVSTHLIIGLGETEGEAASLIQTCVDLGVLPALFAFTPIKGTALASCPPPKVGAYRRMQMARYLIANGMTKAEDMSLDEEMRIIDFGVSNAILTKLVESGEPFLTSGCPDCNRPFYNEKPSGPIYNFPRSPSLVEIAQIKKELRF